MSDSGRYSIWKGEPAMDSWYSAAINANLDCRKGRGDTDMEEMLFFDIAKSNQVKYPSGDANDWFYGISTIFDSQIEQPPLPSESSGSIPRLDSRALLLPTNITRRLTTNKTLPPVPNSRTSFASNRVASPPYFDYLFADAGFAENVTHAKHSPDNLSFEVDNDAIDDSMSDGYASDQEEEAPSPEHEMPATPENTHDAVSFPNIVDSGFTINPFHHAGIPNTTEELLDSFRAREGTNSAGHFSLNNEADEADKSAATVGFYGGFAIEESPSPYYAPLTDEYSGFRDVRDGAEAFPEQSQDNERRLRAYTLAEADAMIEGECMGPADASIRAVLKPTSRRLAVAKITSARAQSPTVIDLTAENSSDEGSNNSSWTTRVDRPLPTDTPLGKKRNARDSFVTKSTFDTSSSDDGELQHLYTKKVRITPDNGNDATGTRVRRCPSTYSLMSISGRPEPVPVGYSGQFCGMSLDEQTNHTTFTFRSSPNNKQTATMGDCLHPNYLYTHTNFRPCPHQDKLDYNEFTARPRYQIDRCIEYASDLSVHAADTPRTAAEEALRCEVHHECTAARLEGVSVGEYRYYQGHLNIEEYKEAGMCICWETCECSKLCTHFGDLLCPCLKHIEIHQH